MLELRELDRSARRFYARAYLWPKNVGWGEEPPDEETLAIVGDGPGRLLDAGCGAGRHTIAFAERGWDTVGIDVFARPIARARRRAAGTGARFVRSRATALDRTVGGSFDVVLDVLGPTSDLDRRFLGDYGRAVRAVLARGGRFVVRTFLGEAEIEPLIEGFEIGDERPAVGSRWLMLYPANKLDSG